MTWQDSTVIVTIRPSAGNIQSAMAGFGLAALLMASATTNISPRKAFSVFTSSVSPPDLLLSLERQIGEFLHYNSRSSGHTRSFVLR